MLVIKTAGLAAIAAIAFAACNPAPQTSTNQTESAPQAQTQTDSQSNTADATDTDTADTGTVANANAGQYIDYTPQAAVAAAEDGDAVLFFHATWCPSCRAADKEITSQADSIPAGLTILKTDYDAESELKQEYGVVGQHTFVQVDASGELINKWSGGGLQDIIDNV